MPAKIRLNENATFAVSKDISFENQLCEGMSSFEYSRLPSEVGPFGSLSNSNNMALRKLAMLLP